MSGERKDGGQVFPAQTFSQHSDGTYSEHTTKDGMSLRDYFAAKAMQASIANDAALRATFAAAKGSPADGIFALALTSYAYAYADAMIKAREK